MFTATFHTHFGASNFLRSLKKQGKEAEMMPVPRVLSASCGVCVKFKDMDNLDFPSFQDLDSVYIEEGENKFKLIFSEE